MNGSVSRLTALVLWCCLLLCFPPNTSATPFLVKTMSVAFKSSLLRLSFSGDSEELHSVLLNVRGGGAGQSTINDTDTVISDVVSDESISSVPYNFSLFQKGDGSESDPDGIPGRYLRMQKGNRVKAKAALEATLAWRKEHNVDTILSRPHPKYDVCKRACPQYFCGRDPTGVSVCVESCRADTGVWL